MQWTDCFWKENRTSSSAVEDEVGLPDEFSSGEFGCSLGDVDIVVPPLRARKEENEVSFRLSERIRRRGIPARLEVWCFDL